MGERTGRAWGGGAVFVRGIDPFCGVVLFYVAERATPAGGSPAGATDCRQGWKAWLVRAFYIPER